VPLATNNKDFRVKNGLIVEGTTATVNGKDVLTTGSNLEDLENVNIDSEVVSNGYVLSYSEELSKWIASDSLSGSEGPTGPTGATGPEGPTGPAGSAVSSLSDIQDVEIYDAIDGDTLLYDSILDKWVNAQPFSVSSTTVSPVPPPNPNGGDGWFDSNTGVFYIYY
jgi:hypothetical protein